MNRSPWLPWILAFALGTVAPAPVAAAAPPRPIREPPVVDGCLQLDFYVLTGFALTEPDVDHAADSTAPLPDCSSQIPAAVRAWSGRQAVLTGYMLPVKLNEQGQATQLLLMANLMLCCYGTVPKMNDWVVVDVPGGTPVVQDVPIAFRGRFTVGAIYQDRYLTGIYRMQADGPGKRTE